MDQAAALGIEHLIGFGLHGDDSAKAYVAMIKEVALGGEFSSNFFDVRIRIS